MAIRCDQKKFEISKGIGIQIISFFDISERFPVLMLMGTPQQGNGLIITEVLVTKV